MPPLERPSLKLLRSLGFTGTDAAVIERAAKEAPALLAAASSASAMWTANAATVSPSADTHDGRVHFTPANLSAKLHRAIEHEETRRTLSAIFADEQRFQIHHALPGTPALGDEGAANHTRFCRDYGAKGVEFFVYGRSEYGQGDEPKRFPARQTLEASRAVARLHGLSDDATVFAQQLPEVIDAGVFHNDVIAVGNGSTLFCHQRAFLDQANVYDQLRGKLAALGGTFNAIEVPEAEVSVADAVSSYLFNSQLLNAPDGRQVLVVPQECRENTRVASYLDSLKSSASGIDDVLVFDLRESMKKRWRSGLPASAGRAERRRIARRERQRVDERRTVRPARRVDRRALSRPYFAGGSRRSHAARRVPRRARRAEPHPRPGRRL